MRTKFLAAVLWGAAAAAVPVAAHAETLIVGNEGTYPPFSMVQPSGELIGIEPDLTREMCARMEVTCEFAIMDFKALIPSLLQGKVNLVGSQVKPLAERKARALFSIPVVSNPDTFVVRADADYAFTREGLEGVRIGIQRGSSQAKYILDNFEGAVEPVLYDNPDQVRLDLLSGRIDATFGAKINWATQLVDTPEGAGFKFGGGDVWTGDADIPEEERGSSWIVRKNDEALLERMNAALSSMIEDCTFTKIREKYLSVSIIPGEAACVGESS